MPSTNAEKKRIEAHVLAAARKAGVPIPADEIPDEEPDFRFRAESPALGIEISELLRPASTNSGIVPVEEEVFHREIIATAQEEYRCMLGATPTRATIYFANAEARKRSKAELARGLTEFVKANVHQASPFITFNQHEVPDGFDSITLAAESGDWWSGECGGFTVSDIHQQLAARISAKDKLVPTYLANLPPGAHVWLLLYSGVTVSRSMSITYSIERWNFPFRFDRVFWFTALEGQFAEMSRAQFDVA